MRRSAAFLFGMLWLGACGSDSEPVGPTGDPLPTSPFLISNPGRAAGSLGTVLGAAASSGVDGTAYVSLPAGSFPDGSSISIHARSTGVDAVAPVVEGGLDPVAVEASPGDTLDLVVALGVGETPLMFAQVVPTESPPVVVRTDPKPGKRDVPLNAIIVVVFSEPIDSSTITGSTIQLRQGTTVIAGAVQVTGTDHLMVVFQPAAPLAASTSYELVITAGVADLDGEPLTTPSTVSFTTGDAGTPPAPSGQIAFSAAGGDGVRHIYLLDLQGLALTQMTSGADPDYSPAWSPDHTKIAFLRGGTASAGVWVMNADGSEPTWRSGLQGAPAWSPDGATIAVMTGNSLWHVAASGAVAEQELLGPLPGLIYYGQPSWSPDGTTIAFEGTVDWGGGDSFDQVYLLDADGSNLRRLTSDCSYGQCGAQSAEGSPAYSPTGEQLAFWSYFYGITRATSAGSTVSSVSHDGMFMNGSGPVSGIDAHPSWSPDGVWLVYQSPWSTGQLVIRRADGSGAPTVVTSVPGGASSPSW